MSILLSQESVESLRKIVSEDHSVIQLPFEDLIGKYSLKTVNKNYQIDMDDCDFFIPKMGSTQDCPTDIEGCLRVFERLYKLTPAQATDERLWVTFCFNQSKNYCLERWAYKGKPDIQAETSHFLKHWFATGTRGRIRNNCIARLWWMAFISSRVKIWPIERVLERLMFNSDYRATLLERPTSASSINLFSSILLLTEEVEAMEIPYKRDYFRNFMKQVDLIGKRTKLASLSVESLIELLRPHYLKSYKV